MRVEQSGTVRRPLTVNTGFVDGLIKLLLGIQDAELRVVSSTHNVPLAKVKELADGVPLPEVKKVEVSAPPAEFQKWLEATDEIQTLKGVQHDIERRTAFSGSVRYSNGYTFETDTLDQLVDIIKTEPGKINHIVFRQGLRYENYLSLTLWDGFTTADFDIAGDKTFVEHAHVTVTKLLRFSEPDYPWLHSRLKMMPVLVALAWGLSMLVFWAVAKVAPIATDSPNVPGIVLIGLVSAGSMLLLSRESEAAFPRLQVEFGPNWRRVRAKRSLLLILCTAIVIPSLLALLFG